MHGHPLPLAVLVFLVGLAADQCALRFVRGAEAILEAVERGIKRSKQIPSLQGFRQRRGAHHGESLAEDAYLTEMVRRSRPGGR